MSQPHYFAHAQRGLHFAPSPPNGIPTPRSTPTPGSGSIPTSWGTPQARGNGLGGPLQHHPRASEPPAPPMSTPTPAESIPSWQGNPDAAQDIVLDIDVLRPDGRKEHLVIRHARVLIGSGAHCDIRIDGNGAAREHVELQLQGERLLARSLSHSPPPIVGGVPFVAGAIESATQIAVCGTRITVSLLREQAKKTSSPLKKIATIIGGVLVAFVLPVVVFAALRRTDDSAIGPAPPAVPLWESRVTTCKFDAADQATHHAKQSRATAESARERYPFAIGDGVSAVTAFETASACYRAGGRADEATRDDESAEAMRPLVERDYLAHRVRLEHAIDTDDLRSAIIEVRTLRSLTTGLKGAYVDWLAMVDRRLELNLHAAEKKKS